MLSHVQLYWYFTFTLISVLVALNSPKQNNNYLAETELIFEFYIILFLTTDLHQTQIRIACSFLYGSKKNLTPETNAEVQHPENNIKSKFLGSDVR
ncbi:transmembrane protein, putative [Medicago truncatula]|uniref:Transmembrane protein, putative n=1 Tax=Medicago truncatula TaxID=3880 RepID=A0A072VER3_MEDTR|nr:transmembrane protein, putative [Medicago truncatula]